MAAGNAGAAGVEGWASVCCSLREVAGLLATGRVVTPCSKMGQQ